MAFNRGISLTIALCVTLFVPAHFASAAKKKAGPKGEKPEELVQVNDRVIALEAIDGYEFTPAQIKALQKIAFDLNVPERHIPDPKPSKALSQYRTKLNDLAEALESGKTQESELEPLKQKVDDLSESADYESPPAPEPSQAAKKAAVNFAQQLRSNQLASSISVFADEVVDPVVLSREAAEARKNAKAGNQWAAVRDGAASEIGYLLSGWDTAGAKAVAEKVSAWLDANPDVESPLPEAKRLAFEQSAAKMLGEFDSWQVLRHWTERDLARVLSNPQLSAALKAREPHD
jgi:hypothetical protein